MIPALVILALWAALLVPGVVRWLRDHRPTTSITSFHRQLRLLGRAGPKLVAPAHRLGDADTEHRTTRRAGERPQLVLLRTGANDKEHHMRYDGRDDDHAEEPRSWRRAPQGRHVHAHEAALDDPWGVEDEEFEPLAATRAVRTVRTPSAYDEAYDEAYDDAFDEAFDDAAPAPRAARRRRERAYSPSEARTRRTRILAALVATVAATFLLGLVPGLAVLWAVTVLAVVALGMYLGLMYYASSTGLYGATDERRPVARVVMPAFSVDERDDEWAPERYAAAR